MMQPLNIVKISALGQDSNMPFLRNEFSKIFEELFYDGVIYNNDSYLWSNIELKIIA